MRITKIETFQMKEHPREIIVKVHTDEGITGLGETNSRPAAVREIIHTQIADLILDQDPRDIESIWFMLYQAFNHHGCSGAEMRALSAIDIALWDILGKIANLPIYQLLGGKAQERVKVYNTCVGYMSNDDRNKFIHQPEKLAEELLEDGINVMKIWPFDELAVENNGQYISPDNLKKGIEPFEKIYRTYGDEMEVALEGHGRWNITVAKKIAQELEQYNPLWLEDLTLIDNLNVVRELKDSTSIPIAASERLFSRKDYVDLFEKQAVDIVITDPAWTGGITETKKIATQADSYNLPFAPHNCGGGILHTANAHLCYNISNLWMMETVRAFYATYYNDIFTGIPNIKNGFLEVPQGPGLGLELKEQFYSRDDLIHRVTEAQNHYSEQKVYNFSGSGDPWK